VRLSFYPELAEAGRCEARSIGRERNGLDLRVFLRTTNTPAMAIDTTRATGRASRNRFNLGVGIASLLLVDGPESSKHR
jgi:hypothetical protein